MASQQTMPPQVQSRQPGREAEMRPRPACEPRHAGTGRLQGKVALVTGGDSGIGRAVAVRFAREGADVAIVYLEENEDAEETETLDPGQLRRRARRPARRQHAARPSGPAQRGGTMPSVSGLRRRAPT